jgi:hypothetical protein
MKIIEGLTAASESKAKLKESGLIDIWLKSSE